MKKPLKLSKGSFNGLIFAIFLLSHILKVLGRFYCSLGFCKAEIIVQGNLRVFQIKP